jgi:hypothetical protein
MRGSCDVTLLFDSSEGDNPGQRTLIGAITAVRSSLIRTSRLVEHSSRYYAACSLLLYLGAK